MLKQQIYKKNPLIFFRAASSWLWLWIITFRYTNLGRCWPGFKGIWCILGLCVVELAKDKSNFTFLLSSSLLPKHNNSLLTAECIWFKCGLYLRFIPPINLWKIWIDFRSFSKCFRVAFSRTLRLPRSNNLEIQNDENSKWKLVKTRWNPKFGLGNL